jgi:hypothetical protein
VHVLVSIVEPREQTYEPTGSCYDLAERLGVIGSARARPIELSANSAYIDDPDTR